MATFFWRAAPTAAVLGIVMACGGASAPTASGPLGDGGQDDGGTIADSGGGGDGGRLGDDGGGLLDGSTGGPDASANDGAVGDGGRPDASGTTCNLDGGAFPLDSFAKVCLGDGTCLSELHEVSCCGARLAVGIDQSAKDDFAKAEKAWEATCPQCECPIDPGAVAEDGKTGPAAKVQVKCDFSGPSLNGKCKTFFP